MSGLLKCPFCGGKAETYCTIDGFWGVDCDSNACFTHTMLADYATEEEAIKAWNTRADVPDTNVGKFRAKAIDEFVEMLHEKCDAIIKDGWNQEVYPISWAHAYMDFKDDIDDVAEQMKGE